jgi:hypothetical protein
MDQRPPSCVLQEDWSMAAIPSPKGHDGSRRSEPAINENARIHVETMERLKQEAGENPKQTNNERPSSAMDYLADAFQTQTEQDSRNESTSKPHNIVWNIKSMPLDVCLHHVRGRLLSWRCQDSWTSFSSVD